MTRKYTREQIIDCLKDSVTYKECLLKLGLEAKGSNYVSIKKWIKENNLSVEHLDAAKVRLNTLIYERTLKTIPLEDILIENSSYSRTNLKKRLYDLGIKKHFCEFCGQGEDWHGKKMSLILDHANGIHNDNRLENLRILCPNCNATLDTHGGKNNLNKKKKLICINCGGERKWKKSNLCIECNALKRRRVERPPIERLLLEIKELGYRGTGKKYGVSDNSIKKWCLKH